MRVVQRLYRHVMVLVFAMSLMAGRVAAESDADPQAGFGVLIAMIAILVAMIIARRKQRSYRQRSG